MPRHIVISCNWEEGDWQMDYVDARSSEHAEQIIRGSHETLEHIVAYNRCEWLKLIDQCEQADENDVFPWIVDCEVVKQKTIKHQ